MKGRDFVAVAVAYGVPIVSKLHSDEDLTQD